MAKSTQHIMTSSAGVVGLVLLAALATSPALAARREIQQQYGNYAPGYMSRQMQQPWQMGVNIPPAALKQDPAGLPPAAPGHVWVQVPITEKPPQPDAVAPAGPASVGATDPAPIEQLAPVVDPEMLKHCQEPRGQFAHPSDCAKFFNCWDGFVAEQSCPGELVFSDQGPFCDYVKNVDCSARGGNPPAPTQPAQQPGSGEMSEATTVSPAAGGSEGEGGEGAAACDDEKLKEDVGEGCKEKYSRYRSPKNCNVFIVCANNVPHRFECPDTLNYNDSLGVCDYPYRVDCGNSSSAYPTEAPVATDGAQQQQQPGADGEKVPEQVWRNFYQQQFRLPANAASASAYYGGFAHLPPVQVVPGYNRFN